MYNKNDCMIKLIIAKLIILQISAYIVSQSVQSYTHFEIYSKIWICWIQSKIWCWRDQTDRFHNLSNFDDRIVWYNFIEIRFAMFCWFELWMFYKLNFERFDFDLCFVINKKFNVEFEKKNS